MNCSLKGMVVVTVFKNEVHDEERAFYGVKDAVIDGCKFQGPADGESAFKETGNPVSYTHLDVYKRQQYVSGNHKQEAVNKNLGKGDCVPGNKIADKVKINHAENIYDNEPCKGRRKQP